MRGSVTASAALFFAAGVTAVITAACSSGAGSSTPPPQPPSASQVAREQGAARFTDCGAAPLGGVSDSGTAYLGSERIGIDTFPGPDIRDRWEKTSRNFGIVPYAQGPDWAVYKAADQRAEGCG